MDPATGTIWCFGSFRLNLAAAELNKDGTPVNIEPQSLRLLAYLIRNRNRVVSRADLVQEIWQGRAISDWAISGAIKALRTALGDQGKDKQFVRTVHSTGYRFVAETKFETDTPANRQSQKLPTVLVRLFRTPTDVVDTAYLADGLTEDLILGLSRLTTLRVMSYNTSRALADGPPPESAGISHIIDGSLRLMGDKICINVSILDGEGVHQIWGERFDVARENLMIGHDRICARLTDLLSPGGTVVSPGPRGTRNAEAYDHYLKGRYAYFKYEPAAFAVAHEHFSTAAEIDPLFADAFAQQAYCRTTLYVFGLPGADKTLKPAEALARRAIKLDDSSALGHARLGWILGFCGRPTDTVAAFEMAISRDGHNAEIYNAYGETLNRLARPDHAEPLLQMVFSIDSYLPPSWEFSLGHTKVLLGEHDRAIGHFLSVLDRVERFVPALVQLARAYWEIGDHRAAERTVENIRNIAPKYSLAHAKRMFPYPITKERTRILGALSGAGMN